jgi:hypothetical protein
MHVAKPASSKERRRTRTTRKRKQSRGATVEVQCSEKVVDATQFLILAAKNVCVTSDKFIKVATWEVAKLSKQVKPVDLLKVPDFFNDSTASLVKDRCSVKLPSFREQAQRTKWTHHAPERVQRHEKEDALVDEAEEDDEEVACMSEDAARWLINCPGDAHPVTKLVKLRANPRRQNGRQACLRHVE